MTSQPCLSVLTKVNEPHRALICTLSGKLVGEPVCYEFVEMVREEIAAGRVHVILDVAGVDRVNSTGVGILASIYTSASNRQGKVRLVGISERLQRLLEATALTSFLRPYPTVAEALASLTA